MRGKKSIDRRKRGALSVLATALMAVAAAIVLMPFYFMFLSSLKPGTEVLRMGLSFRFDPGVSSFSNYLALNTYRDGIYWQWYKSSALIMVLQTAVGLFFGSAVGYGLAMYRFRGRGVIFTVVLILMMIPFEILLLPLYRTLIRVRLTDSYLGVILPYLVPPFMVFFFRQYVAGLPRELLEAGRIDGCTDYGIFFHHGAHHDPGLRRDDHSVRDEQLE
jgi:arabinosaccharide transport system permease protein